MTRSEILDLGRSRRLFSPAHRKALKLRGPTDLDNAILLCSHHHHRAHDTRYDAEHLPSGDVRFHRRA